MIKLKADAYYQFRAIGDLNIEPCEIEPWCQLDDHLIFDQFFDAIQTATIIKYGPLPAIEEEGILYSIRFGSSKESCVMLLETSLVSYPFGMVHICKDELQTDCILFRISDDNVFEVFIYKDGANQSIELMTMLRDGNG